jgi:hypothetical protein
MVSGKPVCAVCLAVERVARSSSENARPIPTQSASSDGGVQPTNSVKNRVTLEDLRAAESEKNAQLGILKQRENEYRFAKRQEIGVESRLRWHRLRRIVFEKLNRFRSGVDYFLTLVGAMIVIAVMFGAIGFIVPFSVDASNKIILTSAALCTALGFLIGLCLLAYSPNVRAIDAVIADLETSLKEAVRLKTSCQQATMTARGSYSAAADSYANLSSIFHSRINRILSSNWRGMTGIQFEHFLKDVFEELGYRVDLTSATGDQGADLIVSTPHRKIAVQAKGYLSGTVGNKAVQEAHAGMAYYRCTASMVITNSTFTRKACEAAIMLNCTLIDGQKLPLLIQGEISI